MNLIITGDADFLGVRLAQALLAQESMADEDGQRVQPSSLTLVDLFTPTDPILLADARVRVVSGDLPTVEDDFTLLQPKNS